MRAIILIIGLSIGTLCFAQGSPFGAYNPDNPFSEYNKIGGRFNPDNPFSEYNKIGGA